MYSSLLVARHSVSMSLVRGLRLLRSITGWRGALREGVGVLPVDIDTAATVVAALFAAKAAQSAGEDVGHGGAALAERAARTVWRRLRGNPEQEAQLRSIADAPGDEVDVQAVADLLREAAANDGTFAAELADLTVEADQAGLLEGLAGAGGGVHVGKVTQKGHHNSLVIGGQITWKPRKQQ
jgi:hypothetical protein